MARPIFGGKVQITANPMTAMFGRLEPPRECRDCEFLVKHVRSRAYYKCEKRGVTHGAGTDHRLSWPACAAFQVRVARQGDYPAGQTDKPHTFWRA